MADAQSAGRARGPVRGVAHIDAYEAIPYARLAIAETHPERLAGLAYLHGLGPTDPAACRMLELGCASGANLVPMAWYLPDSRFVGIDLSPSQVEAGRALAERLRLGNLDIRQGDVADLDLGPEQFDYIVAHGLYSWVPAPVRSALLDRVRRHLAPGGVAYLSFNALPGWRMRGMLREMLGYRLRAVEGQLQRLQAAREYLALIATGLAGLDALSARYLRQELSALDRAPDSYLYHEYLAAVNDPVLFADFVAAAQAAGLRYLCHATLGDQFPALVGEGAEAACAAVSDPVARQQLLDFLCNRNFHQVLLVREDARPGPGPDFERFAYLGLHADLAPPRKLDLRRSKAQPFHGLSGTAYDVSHPLTKAALVELHRVYPRALNFAALERHAGQAVQAAGGGRLAGQGDHLFGELFQLFALGAVGATPSPGAPAVVPGELPQATALARAEAALGRLVDSRHASLALEPEAAALVERLDGRSTRDSLAAGLPPGRPIDALLRHLARYGVFQG
jgi:SAM-dependent methyltransferase